VANDFSTRCALSKSNRHSQLITLSYTTHPTQQDRSPYAHRYSCWLYPVRSFRHSYVFPIHQQRSPRCGDKNSASEPPRAAHKRKRNALSFLPTKQYTKCIKERVSFDGYLHVYNSIQHTDFTMQFRQYNHFLRS